jgi:hypothetical protein
MEKYVITHTLYVYQSFPPLVSILDDIQVFLHQQNDFQGQVGHKELQGESAIMLFHISFY